MISPLRFLMLKIVNLNPQKLKKMIKNFNILGISLFSFEINRRNKEFIFPKRIKYKNSKKQL